VAYLAKELVKEGHEVHIFHSLDAYLIKKGHLPKEIETPDDVSLHTFRTWSRASSYSAYFLGCSPSITKDFRLLVRDLKPDVVHHHNISLLGYPILTKYNSYLNLYTTHDLWLICQKNFFREKKASCSGSSCYLCAMREGRPPQIWRRSLSFRRALEDIDLLIMPSKFFKSVLSPVIRVKSITLPNFAPTPPSNIPKSPYSNYFLFVGRLEKSKGILNLIKVFAQIEKKKNFQLVIAGEGSLRCDINRLIRKNSLEGHIFCVGPISGVKLYSLYEGANALVVPSSSYENSPLVAIEALSVGTPIIGSNFGGLPEIISKVDRRLLFEDLGQLRHILEEFSINRYNRRWIKEIFGSNYSPSVYVRNYMKAINSIDS
jgi:glycosyltransferase involved in cell wall biosynthesis